MRQIFLDTETTGLSPESGDRIIEIGCVEMVNRRFSGRDLHFYVNPQRASHEVSRQASALVSCGWPIDRCANESDFSAMKTLEPGAVSGMNHHGIGQEFAHVLHHFELAEFVQR